MVIGEMRREYKLLLSFSTNEMDEERVGEKEGRLVRRRSEGVEVVWYNRYLTKTTSERRRIDWESNRIN